METKIKIELSPQEFEYVCRSVGCRIRRIEQRIRNNQAHGRTDIADSLQKSLKTAQNLDLKLSEYK